jgi:hypothetical protein
LRDWKALLQRLRQPANDAETLHQARFRRAERRVELWISREIQLLHHATREPAGAEHVHLAPNYGFVRAQIRHDGIDADVRVAGVEEQRDLCRVPGGQAADVEVAQSRDGGRDAENQKFAAP